MKGFRVEAMGVHSDNHEASSLSQYEFALGDELRGERATLGKTLLDVQRDLRIQAVYIDAIENLDPEAFPNKAFISGYIRSYARYLSLDPDEVFARFCHESGFSPAKAAAATGQRTRKAAAAASGSFAPNFPLAQSGRRGLGDLPLPALGSLLVLVGLLGGLGYGGWTVLENIQRVQFAPIEETPVAVAEIEGLSAPSTPDLVEPALAELASPVAAADLVDLYRHQELEVPILMPRDGPIAAIDPDRAGRLAARALGSDPTAVAPEDPATALQTAAATPALAIEAAIRAAEAERAAALETEAVTVLAERAAWVRVYLENGTVIYEGILGDGEVYSVPAGVSAPMIWAGNSGSVYLRVGDGLHGPIGSGTRAVRNVSLEPASIAASFARVEQVPSVLSQTMGIAAPASAEVALQ